MNALEKCKNQVAGEMTALSKRMIFTILVIVVWIARLIRAMMNGSNQKVQDGAHLLAKAYAIFVIFTMLVVFGAAIAFPVWGE